MKVIDAHCDVLNKMMLHPEIDFHDADRLNVTLERLIEAALSCSCLPSICPCRSSIRNSITS